MKILDLLSHTPQPSKQKVDFISKLPLEMSQLILRKLDPESLLRAAQVSHSWMNICRSDSCLKNTARQHKNAKKLELEKKKKNSNYIDSASFNYVNHMNYTLKQLNDYYKSSDYTQCGNVYRIVRRINRVSYRNQLDHVNEGSNLYFK